MKIISIKISSHYAKTFDCLPQRAQRKAIEKIKVFQENPFDLSLRTHPLSGKEYKTWAFWIDFRYRIKFFFLSEREVLFLEAGTHSIYK
ncbi:hypothetical protein COX24_03775 [bacterium (Candidatus Gribaldobacteria) CG23_combo_of_CG06-09_8_20_14_all_37_87_8]|uniref:Type II toxin-antitoxin system mRNA interferase toxin, RelE/StbE family n=1 Tax=bacterium (Candidatus Gribaldobacteria) CG23_combo_of_CG06-09_8_20_14_all_37_87_8 TaxID=2014278 RepID=A0A2G9ZE04_9BACT|nr:MAG: hypothetical protein AUJ25_02085 [Parcubacteria group bacterium CG1_02_37_13]PIP31409.1 MAG: hypothetical protein COX24_03775 [bacterium (Candidatus Gribaldobacteria) CG23_combo_of_CG06-09_8_20_14_all_37_87_8]